MMAWTLYLKEMKENRITFAFLILATLCAGVYGVVETTGMGLRPHSAAAALPYLTLVVLPFLMLHSFAQEFKGQTHYLLLALPVPRWVIALCKVAAFLSVGTAVCLMTTVATHIVYLKILAMAQSPGSYIFMPVVTGGTLWLFVGGGYLSALLLLMGIVCLIAGVHLLVPRLHGLTATVVFVGGLYLYGRLMKPAIFALEGIFGQMPIEVAMNTMLPVTLVTADVHSYVIYSTLVGMVYVAAGVWLFEKNAKV
jgi:ABC-type transport system involved in multi-copper enzyme maturation permease subunit